MGHRSVAARRFGALVLAAFLMLVQALPAAAVGTGAAARGGAGTPPTVSAESKLERGLVKALQTRTTDRFIVEFTARADLAGASRIVDRTRRGQTVFDALRRTASTSQVSARALVARTPGARAQSFWLTNVLVVRGDAALATRLAGLPSVRRVRQERIYPLRDPIAPKVVLAAVPAPEWGVAKIGADQAWAEGITGQGVVVATIDTGVDYTHEALVEHYRGNNHDGSFSHDYNWWDPTGICGDTPCDNAAHGTHTMGTIVGGDLSGPLPDIGVAPGAEWIAAKGCEDSGCSEGALLSSGQFMIAPTDLAGNNPNPGLRPDIISNSWGSDDPTDTFYLATVQAWRAAGIIPVFAAGNAGPGCGSAGTPGLFPEVISVGATDKNDLIADFSSRGPSPSGKVSPNLSAPGVDVVSSVPGNGYEAFSGTSMATPHTAGTIALMLSAKPALAGNFQAILDALDRTAVDRPDDQCGTPDPSDNDPNYVYGEGRIDAKAAVDLVKSGGTLAGSVTDLATSAPIAGARVSATDGSREFTATTDAAGHYELFLAAGDYVATAEAFGYGADTAPKVTILTDQTTAQDFQLAALPRFTVSGHVTASEDGSPIEGASVLAVGTPVPPAKTDAAGAYSLNLPIGTFSLRTSAGGCTETAFADIESLGPDVVHDTSLFRKLDDFGHGCREIPFAWVDAGIQSALFGDEFSGRLRLPFDFSFYDQTYSSVYLSDNGYLDFLAPDLANLPVAIPNKAAPNAAIYALWQDLVLDTDAGIDYATIGSAPNRTFVIEYAALRPAGLGGSTAPRLTFEIQLHENGTIDLLYGPNPADPGDGRNALSGIENATGTDALQISSYEGLIEPNSAIRIETVASGLVHGTVTDRNDGLPIGGALVTAAPGGRIARTADDGSYTLRLRPGAYRLTASSGSYTDLATDLAVTDGSDLLRDFSLAAPIAAPDPLTIAASVDYGATTSTILHLANPGSAALDWGARERDLGVDLPELPPIGPNSVVYRPGWHRPIIHGRLPASTLPANVLPPGSLATIIDDPAGDSSGPVDATIVKGGSDGSSVMAMSIQFTPDTPIDQAVGEIYVDTDQNPATGIPPSGLAGLPTQDIGADYLISLFTVHDADPVVLVIDLSTFEVVATGPAVVSGQTISFEAPLQAFGNDDGAMDVDLVLGDPSRPMDYLPDVGHGTIEPFTDLPWLSETPESGETAPGATTDVSLTLGRPDLAPGVYHGLVVLITNAPKAPQVSVQVDLTVNLPAAFGALQGTVTDSASGAPIAGAAFAIHTSWAGAPLDLTATTDAAGAYRVVGPAGTWPAEVSAAGYVTAAPNLTIVEGKTATADIALDLDQAHASIDGGPFTFVLTPGNTGHGTIVIGNPGGHEPLTYTVGEVNLGATTETAILKAQAAVAATRRTLPAGADPNARTTRGLGFTSTGPPPPSSGGGVIASWSTGLQTPWGVGYTGDVWLSNALNNGSACGDSPPCTDTAFAVDGTPTGAAFEAPWASAFNADLAYDPNHGLLWQVNVGGDNGIYGLDPADGSVKQVITGSPWSNASQRGLAYDAASDTFYIGGWNEGIVYHVAGLDSTTPGATLGQCTTDDPNISGLAWNPSFGRLWVSTNSDTDTIYLVDPATCATIDTIPHPEGGGFNGAGLDMDAAGNLWTVGQNSGTAYLLDSGLPNFSDAAWLTVSPDSGSVAPDGSATLDVAVDTTGLTPGVYRAIVVVQTSDPDNKVSQVPVTLVVPAYEQGIDAGGKAYTTTDGVAYAADQSYHAGSFGYVSGSKKTSRHAIAGTIEDPLYRSQRVGPKAYRFDVPNGHYRIDLRFAELIERKVGARIFNVTIEGIPVIPYLDVVSEAGGRYVALDRSFEVDVSDGTLDIDFGAHIGDKAIVNAILVTELPPGSPGL